MDQYQHSASTPLRRSLSVIGAAGAAPVTWLLLRWPRIAEQALWTLSMSRNVLTCFLSSPLSALQIPRPFDAGAGKCNDLPHAVYQLLTSLCWGAGGQEGDPGMLTSDYANFCCQVLARL